MKQLSGYDKAQAYTDVERLPVGGYVLRIMGVDYQTNTWGDVIVLSFDIEEGEQKGYYASNYKAQTGEDKKWKGNYRLRVPKDDGSEQDEWTMRRFKTIISNFEESNKGYHWNWDEKTLKGKLIGGLFNNKEYEYNGKRGFFTNCHSLLTVEKIKEDKFTIPADTLLNNTGGTKSISSTDGFMNIPDDIDEELPFN